MGSDCLSGSKNPVSTAGAERLAHKGGSGQRQARWRSVRCGGAACGFGAREPRASAKETRVCAKRPPLLPRQRPTAARSHDRLHRRSSSGIWGRADLHGVADRPLYGNARAARSRDPGKPSRRAKRDVALKTEIARIFAANVVVNGVRKDWRQLGRGSQPVSIEYTARLTRARIQPSVDRVGDSYDNALAETVGVLSKAGDIHRQGPWRRFEAVEDATTLAWVNGFKSRRPLEPTGNIPPAEAETRFSAAMTIDAQAMAA